MHKAFFDAGNGKIKKNINTIKHDEAKLNTLLNKPLIYPIKKAIKNSATIPKFIYSTKSLADGNPFIKSLS